jgi:hypothetical protein
MKYLALKAIKYLYGKGSKWAEKYKLHWIGISLADRYSTLEAKMMFENMRKHDHHARKLLARYGVLSTGTVYDKDKTDIQAFSTEELKTLDPGKEIP